MPTINGVPNYAQPVENRASLSQDDGAKKADESRIAQQAADDAVQTDIQSRDVDQIRNEREALALAAATGDKIRKRGIEAVETNRPRQPEDVKALLS